MFGQQHIQPIHISIVLGVAVLFLVFAQSEACGCATCAPSLCRTTCAADCASCCKCCVYFEARVGKRFADLSHDDDEGDDDDVIRGQDEAEAASLFKSRLDRRLASALSGAKRAANQRRRLDALFRIRNEFGHSLLDDSDGNANSRYGYDLGEFSARDAEPKLRI